MSDYWHAPPQREIVRPYYFQDNDRLPQYSDGSGAARTKLARREMSRRASAGSAVAIEQDANGVASRSAARRRRGARRSRPTMLVGCDGARSLVREQIGIDRAAAPISISSWCWWSSARASCTRG